MNRRGFVKMMGLIGLALYTPVRMLGTVLNEGCKACREAWVGLSKFNADRYQFRYIEPTIGLPKVFLYGDSISIGYTEYVRASLKGKADVLRLHENGSSSHDFIKKMEVFRKALFQPFFKNGWTFSWDVIHFNVGLHDLKYVYDGKLDKEKGKQVSSLKDYEKNLRSIISYLKETYPKASLVFATTTPVPSGEPGRVEGDAKKYNEVALKVLKAHPDVVVNDLYTFSLPVLKKYAQGLGNVHYQPEGYRKLGVQVANVIARTLDLDPNECPSSETITAQFKAYENK